MAADFNEDGFVLSDDLTLWQAGYGTQGNAVHMDGDATGNGNVAGVDYLIWQQQLGLSSSIAASSAVVPEPSTGGLSLLAFGVLLWSQRVLYG